MSATRPILLVEDDDDNAALFEALLEDAELDFELLRAATLAEGCEILRRREVWVAVVDLGLPDASGLAAVTTLGKESPETPLVVLTANEAQELSVDAIRAGAQDYVIKGHFTGDLLARVLRYATERKRTLIELERRNRDVEAFASIASHDLQSPLRRMSQAAVILREDGYDPNSEEFAYWLSAIETNSRLLQTLVDDLLRFARMGKEGIRTESFDLAAAVEEATSRLTVPIAELDARILPADLPAVVADRGLITTLLQNLVGNAIKFVRGKTPEVRICAESSANEHVVRVCDNGIGIEPDQLERIFEPCQRAVRTEEFEGSGLGLATCARIVAAHGGRIWVTSRPGHGSEFCFSLPRRPALARPSEAKEPHAA